MLQFITLVTQLNGKNWNIQISTSVYLLKYISPTLNFIFWHNLIGSTVNQFRYLNMTKVSEKNTTIFALYSVLYFGRLYKSNGWVSWNEIRWVLNVNNIQQTNLTTQFQHEDSKVYLENTAGKLNNI